MDKVKYGNCYQFDIPDDCLNEEETGQVIEALLFDLRRLPEGETFVLDVSIGPEMPEGVGWEEFVATRRRFNRAGYKKESAKVTREDVIEFLRGDFADMLSLPAPRLKRIK